MLAFVNNELTDLHSAGISITDLGLNRGYAVFDFFRIINGKFRFIEEHLERFFQSIALGKLPCSFTKAEVRENIKILQAKNNIYNGFVKAVYTAGNSPDFATVPEKGNLIISVGYLTPPNSEYYTEGVNLISKKYQRECPEIKTTNYFFAQMNRAEIKSANAVDVIYYADYITETSRSNVFFVKNKSVFTPKRNILQGITRKKLIEIAPQIKETDISFDEIKTFDEAFITSTTKELMPVVKIDNMIIGNGKVGEVYKALHQEFAEAYG